MMNESLCGRNIALEYGQIAQHFSLKSLPFANPIQSWDQSIERIPEAGVFWTSTYVDTDQLL